MAIQSDAGRAATDGAINDLPETVLRKGYHEATMLERVAFAIATHPDDPARAAIEAMIGPTDEMIEAGSPPMYSMDMEFSPASEPGASLRESYNLMLDAALGTAER